MLHNVGKIDQKFRFLAGILAIGAGIYFQSWWGALGLVPLATGYLNFCPLYLPFGFSSKKPEEK